MTKCPKGGDFPEETASAARCAEHGITILWHGDPIKDSDFLAPPAAPCLGPVLSRGRPCPCGCTP
ncbi:hypothetical protein ACIOWG_26660 [Streptomyces sp. NPDC087658]|uniref:hypothetical protein n=1 Tax=Streptomyces sp. NPDC087658 TaxID=3365800 RepID=UPI0038241CBD